MYKRQLVFRNDDWQDSEEFLIRSVWGRNFPLADGSKSAARVYDFPEGSYTIHILGKGDTTGVASYEIFEIAPGPGDGASEIYDNSFPLPYDYLRAVAVNEQEVEAPLQDIPWEIVGDYLLTDLEEVTLRYAHYPDNGNPRIFDPMLEQAVVARMASKLIGPIGDDQAMATQLYAEYRELVNRAKTIDAYEGRKYNPGLYKNSTIQRQYRAPFIRRSYNG